MRYHLQTLDRVFSLRHISPILWPCHLVILSSCHLFLLVNLIACELLSFSAYASWSLFLRILTKEDHPVLALQKNEKSFLFTEESLKQTTQCKLRHNTQGRRDSVQKYFSDWESMFLLEALYKHIERNLSNLWSMFLLEASLTFRILFGERPSREA